MVCTMYHKAGHWQCASERKYPLWWHILGNKAHIKLSRLILSVFDNHISMEIQR